MFLCKQTFIIMITVFIGTIVSDLGMTFGHFSTFVFLWAQKTDKLQKWSIVYYAAIRRKGGNKRCFCLSVRLFVCRVHSE